MLIACDYGAPTRRKRLFVIARRDGQPIVWPEPTHGSPQACRLNPTLKPWRTAAECIDWSIPCPSIFDRKTKRGEPKPLAEKTRLGLVTITTAEGPVEYQIVDIGMRMLEPHELLAATCGQYAEGYDLSPAKTRAAKVRLIGNMIPPELVEAVVRANAPQGAVRKKAA